MLDMAMVIKVQNPLIQGVAKGYAYIWHRWSSSLQDTVHKVRYAPQLTVTTVFVGGGKDPTLTKMLL
jgi:hypothetical protein